MRKIAANIIYPVSSAPVKEAYLLIDDEGKIVDIVKYNKKNSEIAGLEYYSGILIPGFVNTHCHLELSHLKGKILPGNGLSSFVKQVHVLRKKPKAAIEKLMLQELRYMWSRGINGLADVVNNTFAVSEKSKSPIQMHNFIELFNEHEKTRAEIIKQGIEIRNTFQAKQINSSFAPHSTYGTHIELAKEIVKTEVSKKHTSIHFFESKWENNQDVNTVLNYLSELSPYKRILLVHNTYLNKSLVSKIKTIKVLYPKLYWVLCPNSNLYISNKLPEILDFYNCELQLTIGTDSLASNNQLSILEELKTITKNFPEVPFSALLQWATINGAKALGMENTLGSFNSGKKPGVLLLSGFNFKKNCLTQQAEVTRLV